jgi:hypothetical protein
MDGGAPFAKQLMSWMFQFFMRDIFTSKATFLLITCGQSDQMSLLENRPNVAKSLFQN